MTPQFKCKVTGGTLCAAKRTLPKTIAVRLCQHTESVTTAPLDKGVGLGHISEASQSTTIRTHNHREIESPRPATQPMRKE